MSELKRVLNASKPKTGKPIGILFQTDPWTYKRLERAVMQTRLSKRAILEAALKDALDKILK